MRCQRSSCCHTSPSPGYGHALGLGHIDTLADGGPDPDQGDPQSDRSPSLHLTLEIDAPLRPSRATLIRQNIDTLTCGVAYWLTRLFNGIGFIGLFLVGFWGDWFGLVWIFTCGFLCVVGYWKGLVDGLPLRWQVAGNPHVVGVVSWNFLCLPAAAVERTKNAYDQLHKCSPARMT